VTSELAAAIEEVCDRAKTAWGKENVVQGVGTMMEAISGYDIADEDLNLNLDGAQK
jgi:hypothetical protein